MTSFGQWLKIKRKGKGLTQKDLHLKSGVSESYISTLERNQPHSTTGATLRPEPDKVEALAKALDEDINEARTLAGYAPLASGDRSTEKQLIEIGFNLFGGFGALTPEQQIEFMAEVRDIGEVLLKRELNKGAAGGARAGTNDNFVE